MRVPRIVGLSASLRNARSKSGSRDLLGEFDRLTTRDDLDRYLGEQAKIYLDQFVAAGRAEGLPFDELYKRLRRDGGRTGLSNSEVCLVAALWGAKQEGATVDHVALADHFPADGHPVELDALIDRIRDADGLILSTPVYFGDRGSLSQRFIDLLRENRDLRAALKGKVYGGVAVGAKRNGGQETTLIYQMLDMMDVGLLGVGNDSETTSQYGGTGHAGDIGTMPDDAYGLNTSIGTGRRVARVTGQLGAGSSARLADRATVDVWILQDRDARVESVLSPFTSAFSDIAKFEFRNQLANHIRPCLACDICPTHVASDAEYRCIIKRRDDGIKIAHDALIDSDIIVPAVYSPRDRAGVKSVYQEFMERTRYLRRGDYVFTDRLVAPLVIQELGAAEHLDIRIMTSFIRHHTVMHHPIIAYERDGVLLNPDDVAAGLASVVDQGRRLLTGRLSAISLAHSSTAYNPVGYVLAQAKDKESRTMDAREAAARERYENQKAEAGRRLETLTESRSAVGK